MLFGDYIKQLRESRMLSLSDAATAIGISVQKLWDAENNRRYTKKVPEKVIKGISNVYKIPMGVIVETTKVKISVGLLHSELLAEMLLHIGKTTRLAARIVNESRQYTPELEKDAVELFERLEWLQRRLQLAYDRLYPNTQKMEHKDGD